MEHIQKEISFFINNVENKNDLMTIVHVYFCASVFYILLSLVPMSCKYLFE